LVEILRYDRPDIILAHNSEPVLVLERTVEVPSGHNVGQRFARLAAAAEARRPLVYIGPYVARKHGGKTEGPRWMNLRLFHALDVVSEVHDTAVTTIDWPVDGNFEIIRTPAKDDGIKSYLDTFFAELAKHGPDGISHAMMRSAVQGQLRAKRDAFTAIVKNQHQYEIPPPSVTLKAGAGAALAFELPELSSHGELAIYRVGMKKIRSDPYTGMAMLYRYLYVLGEPERDRGLILHFPHVDRAAWTRAAAATRRKDIRLYCHVADGIILSDGYLDKSALTLSGDGN
jgi:hypothetical protein